MSESFENVLARQGKLVYTVVGTSMLPMLRQKRDLVIIEPLHGPLKRYDVPLYRRDSGKFVLHRVMQKRADGYVLCGDHQWQREYGVQDRQILGVLTAFVRDGREISVMNRWYQWYVHLWCGLFPLRAIMLKCLALPGRLGRRLKRLLPGEK